MGAIMGAAFTRVVNVRMDEELYRELQAMRVATGHSVPDAVPDAVREHIADACADDADLAERFRLALEAMP